MVENTARNIDDAALLTRLRDLEDMQRATLNLLDDFDDERAKLRSLQAATMNLLEDVNEERGKADETQRALMNILDDIEVERASAEQAKTELESVNAELEGFSYSVSHDLRAPLRAISGFVAIIVEDYESVLDDEGKRYLGLVQENAHNMGQLIDDLLAFSRLSRQQLMASRIDMFSLARATFDELPIPQGRDVEFVLHPVPDAVGDRAMIRQVLVNLLSNAVKFTGPRQHAVVEFGYLPDDPVGAYYVKDNGVGFEMKYVGKLFGVFQRLHDVADFEGTGVGLALVHRIISQHHGRVWAQSTPDVETVFYFTLPDSETP